MSNTLELPISDFGPRTPRPSARSLKGVNMDSGLSTVRNLLYIVLVLALLSVFANIYVGTQLATE